MSLSVELYSENGEVIAEHCGTAFQGWNDFRGLFDALTKGLELLPAEEAWHYRELHDLKLLAGYFLPFDVAGAIERFLQLEAGLSEYDREVLRQALPAFRAAGNGELRWSY